MNQVITTFTISSDAVPTSNNASIRAVVVAQLVEQLLQTQEIRSSNLSISKFYSLSTVLKRRKLKKEAGNGALNNNL